MKPTTTSRLCLLPLLLCVTACGITPDEELYGTWVDLNLDAELIVRRDGTANLFGEEGEWTVIKPRSLVCLTHFLTWSCDRALIINTAAQERTFYYHSRDFDKHADVFQTRGQRFFFRKDTYPETFVPSPFRRVDERPTVTQSVQYDGTPYDTTKENPLHFGSVSIDGGVTWTVLPDIPAEPSRWLYTSVAGTSTFRELVYRQEVETEEPNGEVLTHWLTLEKDLWVIDLSEQSPTWRRIDEPPFSGTGWDLSTGLHSSLVLILRDDGAYLSADGGRSWPEINQANAYRFSNHDDGALADYFTVPFGASIKVARDNDIAWYNPETSTWTLTELECCASTITSDTTANGGFYYLRDNALWSIGPIEGNVRLMDITSLLPLQNENIHGSALSIIDGNVYLEHYGIWKAPLPGQ